MAIGEPEMNRLTEIAAEFGHSVRREKRRQVPQQMAACTCGWVTSWHTSREVSQLKHAHLWDAFVRAGMPYDPEWEN